MLLGLSRKAFIGRLFEPQPRVTVTDANGEYRLPALQPVEYSVTFTLAGMATSTRRAAVQLSQNTIVDVALGLEGVSESIRGHGGTPVPGAAAGRAGLR